MFTETMKLACSLVIGSSLLISCAPEKSEMGRTPSMPALPPSPHLTEKRESQEDLRARQIEVRLAGLRNGSAELEAVQRRLQPLFDIRILDCRIS